MILPPELPKTEAAAALLKGAVSAIPVVGGVVAELANLYLNPMERRKQAWVAEVSQAINAINARFALLPEDLERNESFISFLYQATLCALKNHRREKLKALKGALISSLDTNRFPEDTALQFLRYIDELTVTHLALLSQMSALGEKLAQLEMLEHLYTELSATLETPLERTAFRTFVYDLDSRFLIRVGDLIDFPEYASKRSFLETEGSVARPLQVTPLGFAFLSFLSA